MNLFTESRMDGYFRIEKSEIWESTKYFKTPKTALIKYTDFFLVRKELISETLIRKYQLKKIYTI
jgi:hypothetical protein